MIVRQAMISYITHNIKQEEKNDKLDFVIIKPSAC